MKYTITYKENKIAEVKSEKPLHFLSGTASRHVLEKIYPNANINFSYEGVFNVKVDDGKKYHRYNISDNFIYGTSTIFLTQEDKNRVYELCNKYPEEYISDLHQILYQLYQGKIMIIKNLDGVIIKYLLKEATSIENSKTLRKIFLCMAKGLECCSKEDLNDAGIRY